MALCVTERIGRHRVCRVSQNVCVVLSLALVFQSPGPSVAPIIAWSPEPSVIIGVLALTALYLIAWRRARATGSPHALPATAA